MLTMAMDQIFSLLVDEFNVLTYIAYYIAHNSYPYRGIIWLQINASDSRHHYLQFVVQSILHYS